MDECDGTCRYAAPQLRSHQHSDRHGMIDNMPKRFRPGDAERAYDMCVLLGLDPVPWQFGLLERIETRDVDETFREVVGDLHAPRLSSPRQGHHPDHTELC